MRVACLYFSSSSNGAETNLTRVAEMCLRFSPQICLGRSAVFIEIGKCEKLYSEDNFILRLQVVLKRLGQQASIAIGNDISEALVMAKYRVPSIDHLPLRALVDFTDPFEKDLVIQKNIQKMTESFANLGIKSIGQFKQIPTSELVSRFGSIGMLCMQRLRGEFHIAWPFWKPEEIISEKNDFPYFEFYGELEPILFKTKEQLDKIFQRLWARNLRAQRLQVRVFCEVNSQNPNPYRHFEFDFISPQSSTKGALNIIKERLMRDFEKNPVKTPIEALETKVLATVPGTIGQKNLLHNKEEEMEQMNALLGQLIEVHGNDNVFQAQLVEDRRPEKSWQKIDSYAQVDQAEQDRIAARVPRRPTHLVRPEKIKVTAGFVHIRSKKFRISKISDFFERISGGWVENPISTPETQKKSYERNYYEIDLIDAPTISVFESDEHEFYLHGYFG